jgi:rhamnosyltransferase subunit B
VTHKAHFIIAAVGTAGDTLPLIALAKHLASRGHDIDFLAFDAFAVPAQEAGLVFHRVGEQGIYDLLARDETVWYWHTGFRSLWKYLAAALPGTLAHVERLRRNDTILIASSGAVGLRIAQEKYSLPLVTVHMSPFYFFSRHVNVIGGLGAWPRRVPQWLRAVVMDAIDRFFIDGACRDDVNRARVPLGLPKVSRIFTRWVHSPDRVVCAVPPWFAPPQDDWPSQTVSVSFPVIDGNQPWMPDDKLAKFLAVDPPPILFAAGTGAGAAVTFFHRAVEMARLSGKRVILVTRWPEQIARPLPENVCHIDYAPFDRLLPHVSAIVHNGGIGTIALAMRAAIPQVIVPFAYDQFYNGMRLAELGAGVVIRRQRTALELAAAIDALASGQTMRAACETNQERARQSSGGVAELGKIAESLIR